MFAAAQTLGHGVAKDGDTQCCREIAAAGPTVRTQQLKCDVLPQETCYQNPKGKIKNVKVADQDPGACCDLCMKEPTCASWSHVPMGGTGKDKLFSCNLYSDVGPTKHTSDGCSAGTVAGSRPPPPPKAPRNGKPNIAFLVVESTDGRTWSPGYQNDAIKLPTFRMLQVRHFPCFLPALFFLSPSHGRSFVGQDGGLNFKKHYANAPVCCPSRATFWSGRHDHHIPHPHPGFPNITVGGAWNNFEGLPAGYDMRLDQVMSNTSVTNYAVKVSGKTDWSTGGHSENVRLDAWTMYAAWPYNISAMGGWQEENGCQDPGTIRPGGGPYDPKTRTITGGSAHMGDWTTLNATTDWILEASKDKDTPWFAFQGMNIVHPAYTTNEYWYDQVNQDAVEVPPWTAIEDLHPCDLQSSMLKGCIPSPYQNLSFDFYSQAHRKKIRSIYYAMIAEFDAMVGVFLFM